MCQSGWGSSGVCAGSGGVARRYTDYESSFVRLGGRDARSEHDDRWKGRDATERSRDLKTQTTRVLKLRRIDAGQHAMSAMETKTRTIDLRGDQKSRSFLRGRHPPLCACQAETGVAESDGGWGARQKKAKSFVAGFWGLLHWLALCWYRSLSVRSLG